MQNILQGLIQHYQYNGCISDLFSFIIEEMEALSQIADYSKNTLQIQNKTTVPACLIAFL
jgi:hypothetical protein